MSDDEDDYIAFGAALKPLEETDNIRKRPIAVEEQIVCDENGRRRFHGAFTGGFSAGHFNTVNTPQGWYPKQFKSSRATKEDKKTQRPEDFMDDEDVGSFGFAAQALKTKSNFQSSSVSGPSSAGPAPGRSVIPGGAGGLLEKLVRPTRSTVGEVLLSRQGWKQGQGIGPKVTKKNKTARLDSHIKTYGCSMPQAQEDEKEEGLDDTLVKYRDFLFAPDEIPLSIAQPKDNFFGIGYVGLNKGSNDPAVKKDFHVQTSLKSKKFSISGEAFGVGADEEDDESIYSHGDMAQYDFSLPTEKERAGKERRENRGSRWGEKTKEGGEEGIFDGFIPAVSKSMIKKHFPCPQIPKDWTPKRNHQKRKSRFEPLSENKAVVSHNKNTNLSVDQRRSALFPEEVNGTPTTEVKPDPEPEQTMVELPEFLLGETKPDGSFRPFARDPAKQTRYEQFQRCVANNRREVFHVLQPRTMTEWEKEREKVEFERAVLLFKPMKGVIGSRFVSAGDSETADEAKVEEGVGGELGAEEQQRKAAEMKMFGQLTRVVEEWHPARLVCVRFNVAHPFGDHSVTGVRQQTKRDTGVTNVFARLEQQEDGSPAVQPSQKPSEDGVDGQADVKVEKIEEVPEEKPSMDLFKAIFADSDSDDDDDDIEAKDKEESEGSKSGNHIEVADPSLTKAKNPWEVSEGNVLRSQAPAKGIFANIDLDALNKKTVGPSVPSRCNIDYTKVSASPAPPPPVPSVSPPDKPVEETNGGPPVGDRRPGDLSVINQAVRTVLGIRKDRESSSEDEYGPNLPPGLRPSESIVISSDSEENTRKPSKKKRKKEKKEKKDKKDKKKKHKKEHKISKDKKKRRYSDSSG